jgi:long-chain acyl-CoA synthetase
LFRWALAVGRRTMPRRLAGERLPFWLWLQFTLADRLVLRKVREGLGGRLRVTVSGAAPLHPSLCEFYVSCGIAMLEGIGMTENTGISNVNRPARIKPGTVGPVAPGVEMKLAPDGEVLFRAGNVMRGYYKDPVATAETIDAEGWLRSGDVGEIDADGYLKITDRKKELIITAGGKNVAPQRVEAALRTSPYISQAVACGDREKFLTALVTLDQERVVRWAAERGLETAHYEMLVQHPEVQRLIEGEVAACNRELASYESIKKFRILPRALSIAEGELTPTLKLRRKLIYERFRSLIEEMYRGQGVGVS